MRKHLGYSVAEWESLPWWQQRMYLSELDTDLTVRRNPDPAQSEPAPAPPPGGRRQAATDDRLRALGFTVI